MLTKIDTGTSIYHPTLPDDARFCHIHRDGLGGATAYLHPCTAPPDTFMIGVGLCAPDDPFSRPRGRHEAYIDVCDREPSPVRIDSPAAFAQEVTTAILNAGQATRWFHRLLLVTLTRFPAEVEAWLLLNQPQRLPNDDTERLVLHRILSVPGLWTLPRDFMVVFTQPACRAIAQELYEAATEQPGLSPAQLGEFQQATLSRLLAQLHAAYDGPWDPPGHGDWRHLIRRLQLRANLTAALGRTA